MSDTRPEPHTATAARTAQWYAQQALYLFGRAERRAELHGERDTVHRHLTDQARATVETACLLVALAEDREQEAVADLLWVASAERSTALEHARSIVAATGADPCEAHAAGRGS